MLSSSPFSSPSTAKVRFQLEVSPTENAKFNCLKILYTIVLLQQHSSFLEQSSSPKKAQQILGVLVQKASGRMKSASMLCLVVIAVVCSKIGGAVPVAAPTGLSRKETLKVDRLDGTPGSSITPAVAIGEGKDSVSSKVTKKLHTEWTNRVTNMTISEISRASGQNRKNGKNRKNRKNSRNRNRNNNNNSIKSQGSSNNNNESKENWYVNCIPKKGNVSPYNWT